MSFIFVLYFQRALESEQPPEFYSGESEMDDDEMEAPHHSRNQTANESRPTSMASRRARGRGRGRGKFTSAGKATQNK